MDIQDRLVVKKSSTYYVDVLNADELLFEFNEFERVIVKNTYQNLTFEFECPYLDEMIVLNPLQEIVLNDFDFNQQEDRTFYPERYIVHIYKGNRQIKTSYFLVKSNVLGYKTDDIRKIVSEFSKGLELDLKSKKRIKRYASSNDLYEKIISHVRNLQMELDYILMHPICDLEKTMVKTHKPLKPSKKSLMMEVKKNKTLYEKTMISYDHHANIVLKKAMKKIVQACDQLEQYFTSNLSYLLENLEKAQKDYQAIKEKHQQLSTTYVDQKYLNNINAEYFNKKDFYHSIKKDYRSLLYKAHVIKRIRNSFLESMNETWLRNIDETARVFNDFKATSNIHYRTIIQFASSLETNKKEQISQYPYKKTSELYEYYVLILLFNTLLEDGFELVNELDEKINIIFENEEFIFNRANQKVRIIYNQIVQRTDDLPKDKIVNQNSISNCPDLVVMVYENNIMVNCFIIEVKCRKKHNIINKKADTAAMTQLKDYTNFWYFDEQLKLHKGAIEKVYCIYPDQESVKEYYNASQICLMSLQPVYDYQNARSYDAFKKEILSYVD